MTAWSKQTYQSSLSSRCWVYTPYDEGWDGCPELQSDNDLRRLVEQERSLSPIPQWAREIIERSINYTPFCPHWAFPLPYLEVLDAIGKQSAPAFVHGCYTANRERKERMLDYIFCLGAWIAGNESHQAASELVRFGNSSTDWRSVCKALWEVLGQRSELKELLLRRIVHRQRWWIKSLVWDGDRRDVYCRDQFLGDVNCSGSGYDHYGNPEFNDPYYVELQAPDVKRLEERLSAICADWPWFQSLIHESWLCAPKAFRFLERLLWCVGRAKPAVSRNPVPHYLQCDDTYVSTEDGAGWMREFISAVQQWPAANSPVGEIAADIHRRLGGQNPLKRWLVGLYLLKLGFLNPYGASEQNVSFL